MYDQLLSTSGKIAYDLVRNSQNVVEIENTPFANAIPVNASINQMTDWKQTTLNLSRKTGSTLVAIGGKGGDPLLDIHVYLTWLYNGRYQGKGRYISNATSYCRIEKCDKSISFDLSVIFGNPYNAANSNEDVKARLPFKVIVSIVQKKFGFKVFDYIYGWRGEIGGNEAMADGKIVGWYSYEGDWIK